MPKKTLTTTDREALKGYIETDDFDGVAEILEDYGYVVFEESGLDDIRAVMWLESRGWTCERED